jgi:uncharacterized protein YneF (UPF0154 family)
MSKPTQPFGLVVAALLVGIALGAFAMRMYFTHTLWTWDPAKRFTQKLSQDLDLTPEQSRRVADVLVEQKGRMEDLRGIWGADVRILARDGEDRIGILLTDRQMDKFMKAHDDIHGWMTRFLWTAETSSTALAVSPKPYAKGAKP